LADYSRYIIILTLEGVFSIEVLPLMDWELLKKLPPKWILGYSDISTLSFAYTTITGNASAHGTNFNELSAPKWDAVTSKWTDVLGCLEKKEVIQYSSNYYQSSWEKTFENPG